MDRAPVSSSNIKSVGYDGSTLEVEFSSGVYQYAGVPAETYTQLLAAESAGKFFAANIRGKFDSKKVGNDDAG